MNPEREFTAARESDTLALGLGGTAVTDRFRSDGGISVLRVGWAQDVHETLDVAVSAGTGHRIDDWAPSAPATMRHT